MKKLTYILFFLLIFGCKKNGTSSGSDVDILWSSGSSFTYRYSYGILVGGTWYNEFEVTSGSGDITFKVYVNGSKKETETTTVEEGLVYKISVSVTFGDCYGSNSSTAEIRSSSADINRSLKVDCGSLSIGSVSVSESSG